MADYPEKLLLAVANAVREFYTSNGFADVIEVPPSDPTATLPPEVVVYSASLGYSGPKIRGALVVIADANVLAATNPQREFVKTFTETDHADWIGEVANQIVGALKRQLAGYKVEFMLSTPTVIKGREVALAKTMNDNTAVLQFEVESRPMWINFNANLDPELSFEGEPESVNQAGSGDTLLF